nr:vacuolar protein sorting-associated protein 52 A-like [Ipomoea batatas]
MQLLANKMTKKRKNEHNRILGIWLEKIGTISIHEEYMKTFEILSKNLKFAEGVPMVKSSKALKDVQPELEKLRQKSISKLIIKYLRLGGIELMEQESPILGVTRQPNAVTFKSPSNKLCIPVAGEQKAPSIPLLEAQFMLRPSIQITKDQERVVLDMDMNTKERRCRREEDSRRPADEQLQPHPPLRYFQIMCIYVNDETKFSF